MRRASTCLALLGSLAVLGLPVAAMAAPPTVTFKAKAVPIPKPGGGTYPHTGNILGAGTAVEANFVLTGSGYGRPRRTRPAAFRRSRRSTSSCRPARRSTAAASRPARNRC